MQTVTSNSATRCHEAAPTHDSPTTKVQPKPEPDGVRDWIKANSERMRLAYDESTRADHLLWLALECGVPFPKIIQALAVMTIHAMIETRFALEGLPMVLPEPEAYLAAKNASIDEPLRDALDVAGRWIEGGEVDEDECIAKWRVARAHADAMGDRLDADVAAGVVADVRDVLALPPEEAADSQGLLRWRQAVGAHLAADFGYVPVLAHPDRHFTHRQIAVTKLADAARLVCGDEVAVQWVRLGIPFTDLPTAEAWDRPAPAGRGTDGEPFCVRDTAFDWASMAYAMGLTEPLGELLGQAIEDVGRERGGDTSEALATLKAARAEVASGSPTAEDRFNELVAVEVPRLLRDDSLEFGEGWDEADEAAEALLLPRLREAFPQVGEMMAAARGEGAQ